LLFLLYNGTSNYRCHAVMNAMVSSEFKHPTHLHIATEELVLTYMILGRSNFEFWHSL